MTRRVMMSKKQLEFNFNKSLVEASNKYDGTNYIYNAADGGIYTEQQLKKKFTAQDNYKLLKSVANQQEKKEFRDIERKYKPQKVKGKVYGAREFPFKIDITPLPQINPFANEKIKESYNAGTNRENKLAKVRGGLAKILEVEDVER